MLSLQRRAECTLAVRSLSVMDRSPALRSLCDSRVRCCMIGWRQTNRRAPLCSRVWQVGPREAPLRHMRGAPDRSTGSADAAHTVQSTSSVAHRDAVKGHCQATRLIPWTLFRGEVFARASSEFAGRRRLRVGFGRARTGYIRATPRYGMYPFASKPGRFMRQSSAETSAIFPNVELVVSS